MRTSSAGLALVVAVLGGCSSDDGTDPTAGSPAATGTSGDVCGAVEDFRTSLAELQAGRAVQGGTDALSTAWSDVQQSWAQLADAARGSHADEVDGVQASADDVQAALTAAQDSPSAGTLGDVGAAVQTFLQDAGALADDLDSSC